jgi:hypothetical protein
MALERNGIPFEYQYYIPFKKCGLQTDSTAAFIDFMIPKPWGTLLLEVDEDQHFTRPPECDARRDVDIAASTALGSQTKAVILRYNPDPWSLDNNVQRWPPKKRLELLVQTIRQFDEDPVPNAPFARRFLFYDAKSTENLPEIASEWPPALRECSAILKIVGPT